MPPLFRHRASLLSVGFCFEATTLASVGFHVRQCDTGEKGFGPGYYRVGTIAVGDSFEISLFPATVARSEPKSDGSVRIRTTPELRNVAGRVILNVFGEEIFREPSTGD